MRQRSIAKCDNVITLNCMTNALSTTWISLHEQEYNPNLLSEQVYDDNPYAAAVAMPLFRAGVECAAMTCRKGHCSRAAYPPDCHYVRLLLQGEQTAQLGDKAIPLRPGDLLYCPPDLKAFYTSEPEAVTRWMYFKIHATPNWEGLGQRGAFVEPYESADLMFLLLRRILDAHRTREVRSMAIALGDSNMLLRLLRRLCSRTEAPDKRLLTLRDLVARIGANPTDGWTQSVMADIVCVSPRTLQRLFREEYGCAPMEMVVRQRLNRAMNLLTQTEESVTTISYQCGYENVSSFIRAFRREVGSPPAQYRKGVREQMSE